MRNISIIALLCSIISFADTAFAQGFSLFEKQRVVIADVLDRNDRRLSDGVKRVIKQGLVDACTNSADYEVYEVNIDDIKQQLKAAGKAVDHPNICKQIGTKADYIIFTEVKLSSSVVGAQDVKIYITSSLHRIAVASEVKSVVVEAKATSESMLSETNRLFSNLLGVGVVSTPSTKQSVSQSQTYQSKSYAVGDYYDDGVRQGVVFAVTPDGKHGKIVHVQSLGKKPWSNALVACSGLGKGWRLPSIVELQAIYRAKEKLNAILTAIGDPVIDGGYWSSENYDSDFAWLVNMGNGDAFCYGIKTDYWYVRAVSAF